MKKLIFTLCLAILLCAVPVPAQAEKLSIKPKETMKILFVGNSYTQRNQLPKIFQKLCKSSGREVFVRAVTKPGHSLKNLSNPNTRSGKKLHRLLKNYNWDYVILQDRHRFPIKNPQKMKKTIRKLAPDIKESGATMVLFQTWAPQSEHFDYYNFLDYVADPSNYQYKINQVIDEIAKEQEALVAPIGTIFLQCRNQNPQLKLLKPDGSHPTWAGSYLAACVMYSTLFGKSPSGIPFYGKLQKTTANKLQKLAGGSAKSVFILPKH